LSSSSKPEVIFEVQCHEADACLLMKRDMLLNDEVCTGRVTREGKDALARILTAISTGVCYHCKRPVREDR